MRIYIHAHTHTLTHTHTHTGDATICCSSPVSRKCRQSILKSQCPSTLYKVTTHLQYKVNVETVLFRSFACLEEMEALGGTPHKQATNKHLWASLVSRDERYCRLQYVTHELKDSFKDSFKDTFKDIYKDIYRERPAFQCHEPPCHTQ